MEPAVLFKNNARATPGKSSFFVNYLPSLNVRGHSFFLVQLALKNKLKFKSQEHMSMTSPHATDFQTCMLICFLLSCNHRLRIKNSQNFNPSEMVSMQDDVTFLFSAPSLIGFCSLCVIDPFNKYWITNFHKITLKKMAL